MEEVSRAYDRWSATYDRQSNATRDLDEAVLRSVVPDLSGLAVIECGCGTGKNSAWLAALCTILVGLDFSAGMLALARAKVRAPNALFLLSDVREPWPVQPSGADVVLFNLVLEHVEDLGPLFRHAGNSLRRGGRLVLSEYHPARVAEGKGPVMVTADGSSVRIPNFLHTRDDYLEAASGAGLVPLSVGEWWSHEEDRGGTGGRDPAPRPQLISAVFEKTSSRAG